MSWLEKNKRKTAVNEDIGGNPGWNWSGFFFLDTWFSLESSRGNERVNVSYRYNGEGKEQRRSTLRATKDVFVDEKEKAMAHKNIRKRHTQKDSEKNKNKR